MSAARYGRAVPPANALGVAVVGLGYWGPNLLRVLLEQREADVRWVCDSDAGRLDSVLQRYPGIGAATDLDQVLRDPGVDAVLVATPVFTHYELGRRCLEAGKHAFIEKPLASSSGDAAELIELAVERDLVLMCGHTFLYSPPVQMIRRLIDGGELGDLHFLSSSRVNLGLHQPDVSVLWDLGPHDFAILLYWLDERPKSIHAMARDSIRTGVADVAFVALQFESGLIANVELSWLAPSKLRRTVIVGSKQMVVYEDGSPEAVKIYDRGVEYRDPETFGEYHLSYRAGDVLVPRLSNEEPLALQVADFLAAVQEGRPSGEHLRLAYDVVRLAEAADASLSSGGPELLREDEIMVRGS